jgi:hypothetical protein
VGVAVGPAVGDAVGDCHVQNGVIRRTQRYRKAGALTAVGSRVGAAVGSEVGAAVGNCQWTQERGRTRLHAPRRRN